jgi:hypothetical protein
LWEEGVDRSKYPYFEIQSTPGYRRPAWRLTTPEDVARLLAEAEVTPTIEKEVTEKDRARRRAQLAPRIAKKTARLLAFLGPTHDLELVASSIDVERALYEARAKARQEDRKRRHDIRDSITKLRRWMPDEIDMIEQFERKAQLQPAEIVGIGQRAANGMPIGGSLSEPVWHESARKLAAEFVISIAPTEGWSSNGVPVCFVEKALVHIGVPVNFTRGAIAGVILASQTRRFSRRGGIRKRKDH